MNLKLCDVLKLVVSGTKIRLFDWKDKSKNIYNNIMEVPCSLKNRYVCGIDNYNGMIEIILSK